MKPPASPTLLLCKTLFQTTQPSVQTFSVEKIKNPRLTFSYFSSFFSAQPDRCATSLAWISLHLRICILSSLYSPANSETHPMLAKCSSTGRLDSQYSSQFLACISTQIFSACGTFIIQENTPKWIFKKADSTVGQLIFFFSKLQKWGVVACKVLYPMHGF